MRKLRQYINSLTKEQRASFFHACGTTEGYLRKACSVGQMLNSDLCMLIEEASSRAVMCEDMRPDCNWAFIRAGVAQSNSGTQFDATSLPRFPVEEEVPQ